MRPIELSPRLLALARQVTHGARFADVGTDHARLPVWLLEQGVISSAVATDLREGPLDRARQTAAKHRVTERVSLRLGDGLAPVAEGEADVIAIAGMGGDSIIAILSAAPWTKNGDCLLLLQPMTSVPDLRQWLSDNGYTIEREKLVQEDKLYQVLTVRGGRMEPLTPAETWIGRQTPGMVSPLRGAYIQQMRQRVAATLEGLRRSSRAADAEALPAVEGLLRELDERKKEWEMWQR